MGEHFQARVVRETPNHIATAIRYEHGSWAQSAYQSILDFERNAPSLYEWH